MNEFYKKIKGYKVNIANHNGTESFIGLVTNIYDETWLELIPFVVTEALKKKFPEIEIISIPTTIFKKLSSIDTIIVLDKPEIQNGNNS